MSRYYVYDNASRVLRSGKFRYAFDVIEQFGGSWRGVLKLDDEAQIAELATFAARMGVREITAEEHEALLKKKPFYKSNLAAIAHQPTSNQALVDRAVRIKDPSNSTTPSPTAETESSKPTVEEAVVLAEAPYVDPLEQRSNKRKPKKKAD